MKTISKVMVVGSGSREHAIVRALNDEATIIFWAQGNAGHSRNFHVLTYDKADEIEHLVKYVKEYDIDFTIVGPEVPLVLGLADRLNQAGHFCFGPSKRAAELEGSKVFFTLLCQQYGIPIPDSHIFDNPVTAAAFVCMQTEFPIVLKANGLAQGKGVLIAQDMQEALDGVSRLMFDREFGDAGTRIIIQPFVHGTECSVTVITDGKDILPLATAMDYKYAGDGDTGKMTGGMGCVSPHPTLTPEMESRIIEKIVLPARQAMRLEGRKFVGTMYWNLMITDDGGILAMECNVRMPDPETAVILARLESPRFLDIAHAAVTGDIRNIHPVWKKQVAVSVVLASKGYPGKPEVKDPIFGVSDAEATGCTVLHAGTGHNDQNQLVTTGGRVLNIVKCAPTYAEARASIYGEAIPKIRSTTLWHRTDIALNLKGPVW